MRNPLFELALISFMLGFGYKSRNETRGENHVDTSDSARKKTANKFHANQQKPFKGMKYFSEYGVYAINEKTLNANQ